MTPVRTSPTLTFTGVVKKEWPVWPSAYQLATAQFAPPPAADGQTGHSFFTTPVNVNVGDVLTGVMTLTGTSGTQHSYSCDFDGIANTTLNITNVEELTWCIETLEAYSITACTDYPNTFSTPMTGINLTTGTTYPAITWSATDAVTDCGQHTIVVDNSSTSGELDICYKASALP